MNETYYAIESNFVLHFSNLIFIIIFFFFHYSNPSIPKLYLDSGRKRHPVSHKLPDSELYDDQANTSRVPPSDVGEIIHELDEKEFDDELNDEQREVMEDIWLKADEMGK